MSIIIVLPNNDAIDLSIVNKHNLCTMYQLEIIFFEYDILSRMIFIFKILDALLTIF